MKKTLIISQAVALGLIAASHAGGGSYSAKSSKAVMPPAPEPCSLQWFLGASAGYLTDAEEAMYHLQFGAERVCPNSDVTHALYLELGYTELSEYFQQPGGQTTNLQFVRVDVDAEIVPLTLNYKYEKAINQTLSWYVGAGAGIAMVDLSASSAAASASFDDEVFYAQAFAGLIYNVNPQFEVFGGARYLIMDDPELTGNSTIDDTASIDGDVLLELGARYTF